MKIIKQKSKSVLRKIGSATTRSDKWVFCLYVAGRVPQTITTFNNLKLICEEHLKGRYQIEVIDLLKNPEVAHDDQILAIPTLVRKIPLPTRKIIGDLSNTERLLVELDLKEQCALYG